jgi:hypothetical protein
MLLRWTTPAGPQSQINGYQQLVELRELVGFSHPQKEAWLAASILAIRAWLTSSGIAAAPDLALTASSTLLL